MRPMRSRRIAAIGASSTGARSTARPGSARRKLLTQAISGNSRSTWRNESRMPISSTPMIRALSPGLARNAAQIWRLRITTSSAPMVRKTSIRTRKIRGEDTLNGSSSCRSIDVPPKAIASAANMAQVGRVRIRKYQLQRHRTMTRRRTLCHAGRPSRAELAGGICGLSNAADGSADRALRRRSNSMISRRRDHSLLGASLSSEISAPWRNSLPAMIWRFSKMASPPSRSVT